MKVTFIVIWSILAILGIVTACGIVYTNIHKDREILVSCREKLLRNNKYARDTVSFNIHGVHDSIRAGEIRKYFGTDTIVGRITGTWEKSIAMARFVAANIPHGNQKVNPERLNAIDLWEYSRNVELAFNCRLNGIMLFELLNSIGVEATYVTCMPWDSRWSDCHVVNQVWLPELEKWAMIDSDMRTYATDEDNVPLSLAELRERYMTGQKIFYHNDFSMEGSDRIDSHHSYMASNIYWFSCWENIGYDQETGGRNPNQGRYIHLVPVGYVPFGTCDGDLVTNDAERFWGSPKNTESPD